MDGTLWQRLAASGRPTAAVAVIGGIGAVVAVSAAFWNPARASPQTPSSHVRSAPNAVRVEPADPAGTLGLADHQAAVFEDAQVLGHRRSADR